MEWFFHFPIFSRKKRSEEDTSKGIDTFLHHMFVSLLSFLSSSASMLYQMYPTSIFFTVEDGGDGRKKLLAVMEVVVGAAVAASSCM